MRSLVIRATPWTPRYAVSFLSISLSFARSLARLLARALSPILSRPGQDNGSLNPKPYTRWAGQGSSPAHHVPRVAVPNLNPSRQRIPLTWEVHPRTHTVPKLGIETSTECPPSGDGRRRLRRGLRLVPCCVSKRRPQSDSIQAGD